MKKKDIIYLIKLFVIIFLFFNINLLIIPVLNLFGIDSLLYDGADIAYLNALDELVLFGVVYLLYHKDFKRDFNNFKLNSKNNFSRICYYFAMCLAIKIGFSFLTGVLSMIFGVEIGSSENQNIINSITNSAPFIMLISTSLLAPFVEEGIFRLGFKRVFKEKYTFIIISGLVFGLMHIFPTDLPFYVALIQSIVYVAMGIYLAYIYDQSDNIWISIIIHALNNFISIIALLTIY